MWDEGFINRLAAVLAAHVTKLVTEQIKTAPEMRVAPRIMTISQTAGYLGRSVAAIERMIHKGQLKGCILRADRRVHVDKVALDEWITRNRL